MCDMKRNRIPAHLLGRVSKHLKKKKKSKRGKKRRRTIGVISSDHILDRGFIISNVVSSGKVTHFPVEKKFYDIVFEGRIFDSRRAWFKLIPPAYLKPNVWSKPKRKPRKLYEKKEKKQSCCIRFCQSGGFVVAGASSIEHTRDVVDWFVQWIQEYQQEDEDVPEKDLVKLTKLQTDNIVASGKFGFGIHLEQMCEEDLLEYQYDCQVKAGLHWHVPGTNVKATIHATGSVLLMGGKTIEECNTAIETIFQMVSKFNKEKFF